VKAEGEPDWPQIRAFEDRIVDKLVKGVAGLLKARKVDVVKGTATLCRARRSEVDGTRLEAADVVLATGSRPRLLPDSSRGAHLHVRRGPVAPAPASAVIIGAGAIAWSSLLLPLVRRRGHGARDAAALAPLEDADVSKEIARAFASAASRVCPERPWKRSRTRAPASRSRTTRRHDHDRDGGGLPRRRRPRAGDGGSGTRGRGCRARPGFVKVDGSCRRARLTCGRWGTWRRRRCSSRTWPSPRATPSPSASPASTCRDRLRGHPARHVLHARDRLGRSHEARPSSAATRSTSRSSTSRASARRTSSARAAS